MSSGNERQQQGGASQCILLNLQRSAPPCKLLLDRPLDGMLRKMAKDLAWEALDVANILLCKKLALYSKGES